MNHLKYKPNYVSILNVTVLPDPSSYLSRHEEIIHQNNNEEMAHETQSNSSTGSQYLQEVLGDALADALSKVSLGQIGLQLKFNYKSETMTQNFWFFFSSRSQVVIK